jgi:hypothetical protein
MKMSYHIIFSFCITALLTTLMCMPQSVKAQRLSHPNYGGGGARPSAAPAQNFNRPAPVMTRPANNPAPSRPPQQMPSRPPQQTQSRPIQQPQPTENRQTISGGNNNHDYNQHNYSRNTAAYRAPVTVQRNVTVQHNVTVHENVNVYHNHYQPVHAYAYHPYHPYYWGHNWHPLGFFAATLATDAFLVSAANQQYYYDEGVYYQPLSGGYSVVPAPVGATVSSLPPGYETTMVGNDYYYYYGGAFYVDTGNGYQVVAAPYGAVVTQIPDGAIQQDINGQTYLVYNNTYYQPVSQNGTDAYEVVQVN